jgi:phenylalanyl-tRNA synthetase beta chain
LPGVSTLFEPGTVLDLWKSNTLIGQAGQIARPAIDAPAWAGLVFGLEVVVAADNARQHAKYRALPVFPPIEQDIALLVPAGVSGQAIAATIRDAAGKLLEEISVFDLYRGKGIPEGTRSLAYRLRFRAEDRTLTDAEATVAVQRVLKRLKDEHGIERR